jgi:hypothetical protein
MLGYIDTSVRMYMYALPRLSSGLHLVDKQRIGPQTLVANECGRVITLFISHCR